ncbi:hypothetical protein ACN9JG_04035 [Cereibacter azotoformans]|uniref:hypothetical protein n=1 Tax=Cereibacter azotoformans TaxID=43057 RepID=UPI003B212060
MNNRISAADTGLPDALPAPVFAAPAADLEFATAFLTLPPATKAFAERFIRELAAEREGRARTRLVQLFHSWKSIDAACMRAEAAGDGGPSLRTMQAARARILDQMFREVGPEPIC